MAFRRYIWCYTIFCSVFVLCSKKVAAQYSKTDSTTVFSTIDKAEEFFTNSNYDSALFYCNKAEEYSRLHNFKKGQAYAQIEATDIYIDKDDLVKADITAAAVNKLGLQIKDSLITAVSWMQMAQIKMYSDKFDAAVPLFEKSLQYYLEKYPTKYSALAYNDLGYTWGRKGELSKQADALLKSIRIYENYFPDRHGELAIALSNLSTVYYGLNQKDKAIEYAKRSLVYREKTGDIARLSLGCCNISQYYIGVNNDEAEKYLQQCVKYALQSKQEARIVHSYVTAAYLYNTNHKPGQALEYEMKAIAMMEKSKKDSVMLARRYMSAGSICQQLKKDTAITMAYYNKSLAILKLLPDKFNLRDFYLQLSNYYKEIQNYDAAYNSYKQYILYKDSIVSANTQSSIAEIATKYETEKKDNEISKLQINQKIRQLEIEKQKAIIAGNLSEAKQKQNEITLLSQQKELQDARIKQQGELLEKQQLVSKNDQQQLKLSQQERELKEKELQVQKQLRNIIIGSGAALLILGGFIFNRYQLKKKLEQQNELLSVRNNIARDLHDEIGSTLTSIKILSEVSRNNIEKDSKKSSRLLSQITEQSAQMQQGMSDIIWAIKPDNDKLENILARMREYTNYALENKNIAVAFSVNEKLLTESLSMQQRRDLFLIFKEAVNNAAKYSAATKVDIVLQKENDNIILQVKDNGKGFNEVKNPGANGLINIRSRAAALGGIAQIIAAPGEGTTVSVKIPAT
ncbi:histidine kinase [Ferruginibacter sp. SUN106]|uniref:tetratricopeptide repeat-containing sensor histidine kinase n=1 Tax=Ferruginibacter sp. SUN106 TaxID=2978348 RepID=UPI003D35D443